jgi:hypothetical protein
MTWSGFEFLPYRLVMWTMTPRIPSPSHRASQELAGGMLWITDTIEIPPEWWHSGTSSLIFFWGEQIFRKTCFFFLIWG